MTGTTQCVGPTVGFFMSHHILWPIPLICPGIGVHRLRPIFINVAMAVCTTFRAFKITGLKHLRGFRFFFRSNNLRLLGRNLFDRTYLGSADESAVLAPGRPFMLTLRGQL